MFNFLNDFVRILHGEEEREVERVDIIEDLSESVEKSPVSVEVEDWTNGRPYPLPEKSYSSITRIISNL